MMKLGFPLGTLQINQSWRKTQIEYSLAKSLRWKEELILHTSGGSVVKNLPVNARNVGDSGSIPGSGRSPGEGNINPFQYSCLGNPMYRGAWQATQSVELERVRHDKHACADTHTHTHTSPTVLWNNHLTSVYLVAGDPVCCPPPPVKYSHHNDFGTWKPSPAPVWWPI